MSDAAGASQLPNQPPGGGSNPPFPNDKAHNGHNNWKKGTCKTCKCFICGEKSRRYNWRCDVCSRDICAECAEYEGGASSVRDKWRARNNLEKVCNCCYPSGQDPKLYDELKALGPHDPPRRDSEMAKDRQIKADQKHRRQQMRQQVEAEGKVQPGESGSTESTTQKRSWRAESSDDLLPSNSHGMYGSSDAIKPPIATGKRSRKAAGDKANEEPSSLGSSSKRPQDSAGSEGKKSDTMIHRTQLHANLSTESINHVPVQVAQPPGNHLRGGHTVIIGAGIIGLFIALELASKAQSSNIQHGVTIVELRDSYCQLASKNCSGLLSTNGMPETLNELAKLSEVCWAELRTSTDILDAADYRENSVWDVVRQSGREERQQRPSWFVGNEEDCLVSDRRVGAKVITTALSIRLERECRALNVKFLYQREVSSVFTGPGRDITAVETTSPHGGFAPQTIMCQNVVLASGPWTTEIFKHLFQASCLRMENNVSIACWYRLPHLATGAADNAGLVFADLAEADGCLSDKITIVGQTLEQDLEQTIVVTGVSARSRNSDLGPADYLDSDMNPEGRALRHLRRIANKPLSQPGQKTITDETGTKGCDFVSTSDSHLPIIDKVPASALGKVCTGGEDQRPSGVWLCFGFGMYGTTLAPGVARVLCRRMFGEASGIQDAALAIPPLT